MSQGPETTPFHQSPDTSLQNVLALAGGLHGMARRSRDEADRTTLLNAAAVLLAMAQERKDG